MPAGQGIGGIHDILPAGEIVARVVREARAIVGRLGRLVVMEHGARRRPRPAPRGAPRGDAASQGRAPHRPRTSCARSTAAVSRPGDKLISEQKMVERYGVARGSLREALRFLELQGVLRIKSGPGGGPVIDTPNAHHFASTLALLLQFVGARVPRHHRDAPGHRARHRGPRGGARERSGSHRAARLPGGDARAAATMRRVPGGEPPLPRPRRLRLGQPRLPLPAARAALDLRRIGNRLQRRASAAASCAPCVRSSPPSRRATPTAASDSMRRFFEASLAYLDRTYPEIMAKPISWADLEL